MRPKYVGVQIFPAGRLRPQPKTMASKAARIASVAHQIFGTLPNRGVRTGHQILKRPLTGAYEARFYMEPIEPAARVVRCVFCDDDVVVDSLVVDGV
jgi:hypothetical protein